jgi:hypothetical protein
MQDNFHKIKQKEQNLKQEGEIYHETGRSKGCASVFLQQMG